MQREAKQLSGHGQPPAARRRLWRGAAKEPAGKAQSLAQRLSRDRHKSNGFDTIRLIAAALVLISHSFPIATGSNEHEPLYLLTRGQSTLGDLSVGAFFFISGLLISNSFDASQSIADFLGKRVLRIMPALIVICIIITCILGPFLTDQPFGVYFAGSLRFMKNAVFLPSNFELPGVFRHHPMAAVDGSLWSLKFEVACYGGAALLLLAHRRRLSIALAAWIVSFFLSALLNGGTGASGAAFYIGTSASLYRFFGAGVVCYVLRDHIRLRKDLAWIALALSIGAIVTPFFVDAAAVFASYALLVFAYECPEWFSRISARGDISYGTYLYAFPIQQMVFRVAGADPWVMVIIAMPLTLLIASASWVLVERPALAMKKKIRARRSGPQPSSVVVGAGEAAVRTDLNPLP